MQHQFLPAEPETKISGFDRLLLESTKGESDFETLYHKGKEIGHGASGTAYRVVRKRDGAVLAAKEYKKDVGSQYEGDILRQITRVCNNLLSCYVAPANLSTGTHCEVLPDF